MTVITNTNRKPVAVFNNDFGAIMNYAARDETENVITIVVTGKAFTLIFEDHSVATFTRKHSEHWKIGFDCNIYSFEEV